MGQRYRFQRRCHHLLARRRRRPARGGLWAGRATRHGPFCLDRHPAGTPVSLAIKVAVAAGPVRRFLPAIRTSRPLR